MTVAAPRRDGSQIPRASLAFVTQFTIASNGTRDANCITQLRGPREIARLADRAALEAASSAVSSGGFSASR
jgi:hypothetical protein